MIAGVEIVGIVGTAGSGKDTVAHILAGEYGFRRVALADGVRGALRDLYGPGWDITKAGGITVRRALQVMGTECGRHVVHANMWCDVLAAKLHFLRQYVVPSGETLRVVVPDIRFPSEADYLWGLAEPCHIVRITRPYAGLLGQAGQHRSETLVDHIEADAVLLNNGTRAKLSRNIRRKMAKWEGEE